MSVPQEHFNNLFYEIVVGRLNKKPPFHRSCRVDIILPVFNALELTVTCLETVLDNSDNCRLIVVNDASTDPRVADYLDSVRSIRDKMLEVVVLHNEVNQGFLKTVNDAYRLTEGHFVILNSDTEVPPGWLDRLFAPIFDSPARIASVTPFSNSSMGWLGCNFPDPEQDGEIFKGMEVALLDSFFSRYSVDAPIEIFSGCGFCMAFNSAVVEKIGLFNYEFFGKGYCEEVDWSLRAFNAGYKNVLASNLFVFHKYGASFDPEEKRTLQEANLITLCNIYGAQMERMSSLNTKDEIRSIREAIAIIADAHTMKEGDCWVAVVGAEYPSWDLIKNKVPDINANGFVFITYTTGNDLKLNVLTLSQDCTIYLPYDACNQINKILCFLGVYTAIVVDNAAWPDCCDEIINQLKGDEIIIYFLKD